MRDMQTELENSLELISSKVLEIQERAYFEKRPWTCVWCGYIIDAAKFPTFESYKTVIDLHSKKCTTEHNARETEKIMREIEGMSEKEVIEYLAKKVGEIKL